MSERITMKSCQICATIVPSTIETCPNDGEASWTKHPANTFPFIEAELNNAASKAEPAEELAPDPAPDPDPAPKAKGKGKSK